MNQQRKIEKANAKWLQEEKVEKTEKQLIAIRKNLQNLKNKHARKEVWSGSQYKAIRG